MERAERLIDRCQSLQITSALTARSTSRVYWSPTAPTRDRLDGGKQKKSVEIPKILYSQNPLYLILFLLCLLSEASGRV